MQSCNACQALMLEYLYDLLEQEDRRTLQAHLEGCPACQAALVRAQDQQRLLAAAARMEFPQVRFVVPARDAAPVEQPAPATITEVVPFVPPPRRRWPRWVAAAAALLAAVGLGLTAYHHGHEYAAAKARVEQTEHLVAQLHQQKDQAQRDLHQESEEKVTTEERIKAEDEARGIKISALRANGAALGTASEVIVETKDRNGKLVKADVTVQVATAWGGSEGKSAARRESMKAQKPFEKKAARAKDTQERAEAESLRPRIDEVRKGTYRITVPPEQMKRARGRLDLVVSAQQKDGTPAEVRETLPVVAPTYVTHLTTDKPLYQKGEMLHFRSLTLDRATLRPAQEDLCFLYSLTRPDGVEMPLLQGFNGILARNAGNNLATVPGPDGKPVRGIGAGDFYLGPDVPGGEWKLTVRESNGRFPPQTRKFLVNEYQKPQLNKELDFNRSSYGPGDEVQARCRARWVSTGQPLAKVDVGVEIQIDGKRYGRDGNLSGQPIALHTDEKGNVLVRFKLPAAIERGDATLSVTFGGSRETLVRPIPVIVNRLNVEFFPEGGDLVAGVENRVYFQARTPLGKPADLRGQLLENGKPLSVTAATLHDDREPGVNQGMGRFTFTPTAGRRYELRIDSPAGIRAPVPLPEVKADGVVLSVADGVVGAGKSVQVTVRSPQPRIMVVGLYSRGRLIDSVSLAPGQTKATLRPAGAAGVCRVTVFEDVPAVGTTRMLTPRSERLLYCRPTEKLKLSFLPDRKSYIPGDKVKLGIEARDEKKKMAGAVVMLGVVDRSSIVLADDKTARTMPTHFLLTSEVHKPEDLEYADFLLGPQPKAAAALDLLLGTQGWRRFAAKGPLPPHNAGPIPEADRLVMTQGQSPPGLSAVAQKQLHQAEQEHQQKVTQLHHEEAQLDTQAAEAVVDPAYLAALAQRDRYDRFLDSGRRWGPPLLGGVLLIVALVCLAVALFRRASRAVPAWAALAACAAGLILIVRTLPVAGPTEKPGAPERAQLTHHADATKEERQAKPAAHAVATSNEFERPKTLEAMESKPDGKESIQDTNRNLAEENARQIPSLRAPMPTATGAVPNAPLVPGFLSPPVPATAPAAAPPPGPPGAAPYAPQAMPLMGKGAGTPTGTGFGGAKLDGNFRMARMPNADKAKQADRLQQQARQRGANMGMMGGGMGMMGGMMGMRGGMGMMGPPGGVGGRAMPAGPIMARGKQPPFGAGDELLRRRFLRDADQRERTLKRLAPMIVREYAHTRTPLRPGAVRGDYTETLFWQPVLVLKDGKGKVSFDLCDSVTNFQVIAFAHTLDGRLGASTYELESRLPLSVQARTPQEVTASDKIDVPVTVFNNTQDGRTVRLMPTENANLKLVEAPKNKAFDLEPNKPLRLHYRFQPSVQNGQAALTFEGQAGPLSDRARSTFRIVPEGFPIVHAHSDVLEGSASETVTLPETWLKGTLRCRVQVYPSTLADLQQGLAALLREPCGCFEQTSSSNYPNLLVLDYLRETNQARPEIERRARELLARGYNKLTSFECLNTAQSKKEGYEWFGGTAPAHEALTAYGLMEFRDMARVQKVDSAMLQRTQHYLLSQRDGKGGFRRNPRAIDSFGRAPGHITNAYIVWALTEGGKQDDLTRELDHLVEQAKTSKDPYFLALVANSLINRSQNEPARNLLRKIAALQKDDGHLDAASTSITGSGGRDLQIETTALALLGWLKAQPGEFHGAVQKAVRWIGKQRGGYGGFGSTQSTILALKALIAYTRVNKKQAGPGELSLFIGERRVAQLPFAAGASDVLTLDVPVPEKELRPGRNKLRIEITGKNVFPYTLTCTYQTLKPPSAEGCPVRLRASLDRSELKEGDPVLLTAQVENVSGKGQGMAVAILGLPGGLIVPEDMKQLKNLTRVPEDGSRPRVSAFEIRGRELVLYWRDLAPDQKISVPIKLIARVPGEYRGPASRAYLYYNADRKHWIDPLRVIIAGKE